MKRILLIALCLAFCLPLCACGDPDMTRVIEKSRKFINNVDSLHCEVMSGTDITEGEEHISKFLTMTADMDIKNKLYFINMSSDDNGEQLVLDMYITTGDTIDYYIGSGERWVKMPNVNSEQLQGMNVNTDASRDFEIYFDALLGCEDTVMTVENLDGDDYYKLYAPVSISDMEMAKKFSVDTFINTILGVNATRDNVATLLDAMGTIDVTVYINAKTYEPYGFVVDSKPALDELYKNLGKDDITITEAYTSSVYTDYNGIDDLELPEAARFAPDISTIQK